MLVVVRSVSFDHTCGSIFEGINAVLSAFCATKPLSTAVGNGGSTNGCTVRFVYRIFEYSFVLGVFDSLRFRIFVLALISTLMQQFLPYFP